MAAQTADPVIQKVKEELPDLPKPLEALPTSNTSSTWTSYLDFASMAKEQISNYLVLSKWQRASLIQRRLDDHMLELIQTKLDGQSIVQTLTAPNVLNIFKQKIPDNNEWKPVIDILVDSAEVLTTLDEMSASSFFWGLYVDPLLNEDLSEHSKLLIGNAFLFALWKEDLEDRVLLTILESKTDAPDQLLPTVLTYLGSDISQKKQMPEVFNNFSKAQLPVQLTTPRSNLSPQDIQQLLITSPWCSIFAVIETLRATLGQNKKEAVYERALRIDSASLRGHVHHLFYSTTRDAGYANCQNLLSHEQKRMKESRFKLALIAYCIVQKLPRKLQIDLTSTKAAAIQLLTHDCTISFNGTASNGITFLKKQTPELKIIMTNLAKEIQTQTPLIKQVLTEQSQVLSEFTANYLNNTFHELWKKIYRSETLRTFVLVSLASGSGLFLSTQQRLIKTLAHLILQVLKEL